MHATEKLTWKFHPLDRRRGYMSVQVGKGQTFRVYTTPISGAAEPKHRQLLEQRLITEGVLIPDIKITKP